MTRLAQLIAQREGFGIPGDVPTRDNNPGDLRHSPHSSHEGEGEDDIGEIDTVADGWADLERQLQLYAKRGLTISQMVMEYAPPDDDNDTQEYIRFICDGLRLPQTATVVFALTIPAIA